eukprot:TRINITY_DN280_c0_g4_i2.p3 TRINITY_DN280_c0_g4~~TRINITY_DN280_c0_g4_i2.p3  ORF type:complete len:603 (-),score=220.30 TRINITY_DN280_c0_g4_i2:225-2033(-)
MTSLISAEGVYTNIKLGNSIVDAGFANRQKKYSFFFTKAENLNVVIQVQKGMLGFIVSDNPNPDAPGARKFEGGLDVDDNEGEDVTDSQTTGNRYSVLIPRFQVEGQANSQYYITVTSYFDTIYTLNVISNADYSRGVLSNGRFQEGTLEPGKGLEFYFYTGVKEGNQSLDMTVSAYTYSHQVGVIPSNVALMIKNVLDKQSFAALLADEFNDKPVLYPGVQTYFVNATKKVYLISIFNSNPISVEYRLVVNTNGIINLPLDIYHYSMVGEGDKDIYELVIEKPGKLLVELNECVGRAAVNLSRSLDTIQKNQYDVTITNPFDGYAHAVVAVESGKYYIAVTPLGLRVGEAAGYSNVSYSNSTQYKIKLSLLQDIIPHDNVRAGGNALISYQFVESNRVRLKWNTPVITEKLLEIVNTTEDLFFYDTYYVTNLFAPVNSFSKCPEFLEEPKHSKYVESKFNETHPYFGNAQPRDIEIPFEGEGSYYFSYYTTLRSKTGKIAGYRGGINIYYNIVTLEIHDAVTDGSKGSSGGSIALYMVLIIIILLLLAVVMYYKYKRAKLRLKYIRDTESPGMDAYEEAGPGASNLLGGNKKGSDAYTALA